MIKCPCYTHQKREMSHSPLSLQQATHTSPSLRLSCPPTSISRPLCPATGTGYPLTCSGSFSPTAAAPPSTPTFAHTRPRAARSRTSRADPRLWTRRALSWNSSITDAARPGRLFRTGKILPRRLPVERRSQTMSSGSQTRQHVPDVASSRHPDRLDTFATCSGPRPAWIGGKNGV